MWGCFYTILIDTKKIFTRTLKAPTIFTHPHNLFLIKKLKVASWFLGRKVKDHIRTPYHLSLSQTHTYVTSHTSRNLVHNEVACDVLCGIHCGVSQGPSIEFNMFVMQCRFLTIVIVSTLKANFVVSLTLRILCCHCISTMNNGHQLETNCTQF